MKKRYLVDRISGIWVLLDIQKKDSSNNPSIIASCESSEYLRDMRDRLNTNTDGIYTIKNALEDTRSAYAGFLYDVQVY